MARTFPGGANSDRFTVTGAPSALDGFTVDNTFTVISTINKAANAANLNIFYKTASLTGNGAAFLVEWDGVTIFNRLRLIVGRATSYTDVSSSNNLVNNSVNAYVAASYNAGTVKFIYTPIDTLITGFLGGNNTTQAGSGATVSESTEPLYIGNARTFNQAWNGDIGWIIVNTNELTVAQHQRIHYGILVHRQGVIESDAVKKARGAAIITSIAGCLMATYIDLAGGTTEYSGNTYTVVRTGTTGAVDNEITNFDCPTTGEQDVEATNTQVTQEQSDYFYVSSHVRQRYSTSATSGKVWFYSTLTGYAAQSDTCLFLTSPTGAPNTSFAWGALGYNSGTFSGLSAGTKTLIFQNSVRSRAPAGNVHQGSFLNVIFFNAAFTKINSAGGPALLHYGDSVPNGFLSSPTQQNAAMQKVRNAAPGWFTDVIDSGFGGMRLRHIAGDATAVSRTVAQIVTINPKSLHIQLMANDCFLDDPTWKVVNFQAQLNALLNAIQASAYTGWIYVSDCTKFTTINEAATPTNGETPQQYRNAVSAACSGRSKLTYNSLVNVLNPNTDLAVDGVHPTTAGHGILYTNNYQSLFASNPLPSGRKNVYAYRGYLKRYTYNILNLCGIN